MNTQTVSKKKAGKSLQNNGKNTIPPLENGDRLTRAEFERRYEAMPNVKAELIEGVVFIQKNRRVSEGKASARFAVFLVTYALNIKEIESALRTSLVIDDANEYQPDVVLYVKENFGGNSYISADDYLEGSPELVVEIAASTASYDTTLKKNIYRRNGVKEYIIWRVDDEEIDWFAWEEGEYVSLEKDKNGVIESRFFGGLRLNVDAILSDDLAKVLNDLQKGLKSKKHKDFVKSLSK